MKIIRINTDEGYSQVVMGGDLDDLTALIPVGKRLYIITDTNVDQLYGNRFPAAVVMTIRPGEESKTLATVGDLCSRLLEAGADRSSFILGIGGGVVCDITGMVASVYMRGVRHGFAATTLLSQVDASIGGKTGVNLGKYKNIIGTFRQPEFVLCDHKTLVTLPEEEFISGMGELLKTAVIRNRDLFLDISSSMNKLMRRDPAALEDKIYRAVRIKAAVVKRDPLEKWSRRVLNFGHTFGHVIETAGNIPHGIAVMQGMHIAAGLSVWLSYLPEAEFRTFTKVLKRAGMKENDYLPENVARLIAKDKKSEAGTVSFVLLRSLGKGVIKKLPVTEISDYLNHGRNKKKVKQR